MKITLLNFALIVTLVSCASKPPIDVTLDEVSAGNYDEDSIRVSGIVGLSTVIYGDDPSFVLYTGNGNNRVDCNIRPGENKNQMRPLPDAFVVEDVHITDNNGETIHYGDKVLVTGFVTSVGESEYIYVSVVEKK